MIGRTAIEYKEVIATCKTLFEKKTRDKVNYSTFALIKLNEKKS